MSEDLKQSRARARCSIVERLPLRDAAAVRADPDVLRLIEEAGEKLGRHGGVVIRLAGIPQENQILVEGKSKRLCARYLEEMKKLLIGKGYMDCEHVWETQSETDYGEMDYRSDGGGVDHFVVMEYRCRLCGAQYKDWRGDFCGDPAEFLKNAGEDQE